MGDRYFTNKDTLVVDNTLLPAETYCEFDANLEQVVCRVISKDSFLEEWDMEQEFKDSARDLLESEPLRSIERVFKIEPYKVE